MREFGEIVSLDDDSELAIVAVHRTAACKNCGVCLGSRDRHIMHAQALNTARARVGEHVTIEVTGKPVLLASFLIFAVPLILFGFGYLVAGFAARIVGVAAETAGIVGGFLFCAMAYGGIAAIDRRISNSYYFRPVVTEVLSGTASKGG